MGILVATLIGLGLAGAAIAAMRAIGAREPAPPNFWQASTSGITLDIETKLGAQDPGHVLDVGIKTGTDWAAYGAAAGPIGSLIGFALGNLYEQVQAAINHESYGRIVRDAVADMLTEAEYPATSGAVDAALFRNALLSSTHVWWRSTDGALALEVMRKDAGGVVTSIFGPARESFIVGDAAGQCQQQIQAVSPGMRDGPRRREAYREWERKAKVGDLYVLTYEAAPDSWKTPGYVPFIARWPIRSSKRTAKSGAWQSVVPTTGNVDALAQAFDRVAGVTWNRKGA